MKRKWKLLMILVMSIAFIMPVLSACGGSIPERLIVAE